MFESGTYLVLVCLSHLVACAGDCQSSRIRSNRNQEYRHTKGMTQKVLQCAEEIRMH